MTENKTTLVTDKATSTPASDPINKNATSSAATKPAMKKPNSTKKRGSTQPSSARGISKLAIAAIIIALGAPGAHFVWQQQQTQQFSDSLNQISQANQTTFSHFQGQLQTSLANQQGQLKQSIQAVAAQNKDQQQQHINGLQQQILQLEQAIKQRQPSDWLLHEAEYLIRISARTIWLEHDTTAAIGLLNDANARLAELNDPAFLPVREVIHQDIKALALLPALKTDEIVLTLMAMNKQVALLPLAMLDNDAISLDKKALALTDDINDWQSNLAKSWQKFIDDFIRVRHRTGSIEPLIAPEQQANLKQNLTLKIQLALWAASERKNDIYHQAIADIKLWLHQYFAIEHDYNQAFLKELASLEKQHVNYNYPNQLASLSALRLVMKASVSATTQAVPAPIETTAEALSVIEKPVDTQNKNTAKPPIEATPAPKAKAAASELENEELL